MRVHQSLLTGTDQRHGSSASTGAVEEPDDLPGEVRGRCECNGSDSTEGGHLPAARLRSMPGRCSRLNLLTQCLQEPRTGGVACRGGLQCGALLMLVRQGVVCNLGSESVPGAVVAEAKKWPRHSFLPSMASGSARSSRGSERADGGHAL